MVEPKSTALPLGYIPKKISLFIKEYKIKKKIENNYKINFFESLSIYILLVIPSIARNLFSAVDSSLRSE
jgi:hypothetical protein